MVYRRRIYRRRRFPFYRSSNLPSVNRTVVLAESYKHICAFAGNAETHNPFIAVNYEVLDKMLNGDKTGNFFDTNTLNLCKYYDNYRIDKVVYTICSPETYLYTFKPDTKLDGSKNKFDEIKDILNSQFNRQKSGKKESHTQLPDGWEMDVIRTYGDSIEYTYYHQSVYKCMETDYKESRPKFEITECTPNTYVQRKKKLHPRFRMHVAWRPNMKYAVPCQFMNDSTWCDKMKKYSKKDDYPAWIADFNIRRGPTLLYIRPVFQMGADNSKVFDQWQITAKIMSFKIIRKIYISASGRNKMACIV